MQNPGMQQAPAGLTYQIPPNSRAGVISAARPNTRGSSITNFKRFVDLLAMRDAPQYNAGWQMVNDHLLVRNFTPLANFPIADFLQSVIEMTLFNPCLRSARHGISCE